MAQPTGATTATVTEGGGVDGAEDEPFPLSARIVLNTSVGLGTFINSNQRQETLSMTLWPTLALRLPVKNLTLSASMTATLYAVNDFGTAFPNGQIIPGDLFITLAHTNVFSTKDVADGLSIMAFFRVYFPTSPTSQLLNRTIAIRPYAVTSLRAGPVTLSWTFMLMKYFASSTQSGLNCANFKSGECIEGRPQAGEFSSQVDGDSVALTGTGNTSFYVANIVSLGIRLYEGLNLTLSAGAYNIFGFNSVPIDDLSSNFAKAGRAQTDRFLAGIAINYQAHKHFGVGLSYDLATSRPFGPDGQGLVAFETASSLTLTLATNF